jgi:hypothetical protein
VGLSGNAIGNRTRAYPTNACGLTLQAVGHSIEHSFKAMVIEHDFKLGGFPFGQHGFLPPRYAKDVPLKLSYRVSANSLSLALFPFAPVILALFPERGFGPCTH